MAQQLISEAIVNPQAWNSTCSELGGVKLREARGEVATPYVRSRYRLRISGYCQVIV